MKIQWLAEGHDETPTDLSEYQSRQEMSLEALPMAKGIGYSTVDYMRTAFDMKLVKTSHLFLPTVQE